ncbi:hypothetical protein GUITHDRAFT_107115 [Guillardia theta CCMP2712]|uniref:Uncharacterized protein n=1 Tax=Guillardia theta (strain CCMP2712) TaxID=905079 RepID=L1JGD7_GUITC|nr:hypothetical protein GUITHDRAFT_107115 [Guillardia theta CCMP2712]EKX47204.1 hypothetical protein GUITHDRAFT_107115 [Guillardia theta CCMP2712]|eukprot:XP_005834184.1 hypothetical protein GUITHDRAFT_107115 [Guillardia theta CCMP2712]
MPGSMRGRGSADAPLSANSVGFSSPLNINSPQVFSVYNPQSRPVKSMMKDNRMPLGRQAVRQQQQLRRSEMSAPSPRRDPETQGLAGKASFEQVISFLREFGERSSWEKVLSRQDTSGEKQLDQRQFEEALRESGFVSFMRMSPISVWDRAVGKSFRTSGVAELATTLSIVCAEERIRLLSSECSFVDKICAKMEGMTWQGEASVEGDSEDSLESERCSEASKEVASGDCEGAGSQEDEHVVQEEAGLLREAPGDAEQAAAPSLRLSGQDQGGDRGQECSAEQSREGHQSCQQLQQEEDDAACGEHDDMMWEEGTQEGTAPSPRAAAVPMQHPRADEHQDRKEAGREQTTSTDENSPAPALLPQLVHRPIHSVHRKQWEFSQKEFKAANVPLDRQRILQRLVKAAATSRQDNLSDGGSQGDGAEGGHDGPETLSCRLVRFPLSEEGEMPGGCGIMRYILSSEENADKLETSLGSSDGEDKLDDVDAPSAGGGASEGNQGSELETLPPDGGSSVVHPSVPEDRSCAVATIILELDGVLQNIPLVHYLSRDDPEDVFPPAAAGDESGGFHPHTLPTVSSSACLPDVSLPPKVDQGKDYQQWSGDEVKNRPGARGGGEQEDTDACWKSLDMEEEELMLNHPLPAPRPVAPASLSYAEDFSVRSLIDLKRETLLKVAPVATTLDTPSHDAHTARIHLEDEEKTENEEEQEQELQQEQEGGRFLECKYKEDLHEVLLDAWIAESAPFWLAGRGCGEKKKPRIRDGEAQLKVGGGGRRRRRREWEVVGMECSSVNVSAELEEARRTKGAVRKSSTETKSSKVRSAKTKEKETSDAEKSSEFRILLLEVMEGLVEFIRDGCGGDDDDDDDDEEEEEKVGWEGTRESLVNKLSLAHAMSSFRLHAEMVKCYQRLTSPLSTTRRKNLLRMGLMGMKEHRNDMKRAIEKSEIMLTSAMNLMMRGMFEVWTSETLMCKETVKLEAKCQRRRSVRVLFVSDGLNSIDSLSSALASLAGGLRRSSRHALLRFKECILIQSVEEVVAADVMRAEMLIWSMLAWTRRVEEERRVHADICLIQCVMARNLEKRCMKLWSVKKDNIKLLRRVFARSAAMWTERSVRSGERFLTDQKKCRRRRLQKELRFSSISCVAGRDTSGYGA